jgi:membrane fusion protein (multidrug efflux system)
MPTAFSQTYRTLGADRFVARGLVLVGVVILLGVWAWWAMRAAVPIYEVAPGARIEQDAASYPVQSPFAGKLVRAGLVLGREVRRGEILAEVDTEPDRLRVQQEQSRVRALDSDIARLRSQQTAEDAARGAEHQSTRAAIAEAMNRRREAETAAAFADQEEQRLRKLRDARLVAERDHERAAAEARRLRQNIETIQASAARLEQEQNTRDRERDVRLGRIASDITRLEGEHLTLAASMSTLGYEIERRKVRAPADGRIAEAAILHPGAVIAEGEKLAAIVPNGRLHIVAQFPAAAAFGRIRPGQPARVRLDGFPWAEFGTVAARVERVAGEVRDGRVRVELAVLDSPGLRAPLQHGMPGTVEVEVERLAPVQLALRAAGQWLASPRGAFEGDR